MERLWWLGSKVISDIYRHPMRQTDGIALGQRCVLVSTMETWRNSQYGWKEDGRLVAPREDSAEARCFTNHLLNGSSRQMMRRAEDIP